MNQGTTSDLDAAGAPTGKPSDRRRHNRVDLGLKARLLTGDGDEHACIVANISAGGALLKAKSPPPEGQQVVLYIDDLGRFEGKVIRSGRHLFAVDYRSRRSKSKRTADALTLALNNGRGKFDRRAAPRVRQDTAAHVTMDSGEQLDCSILDISLTGASLEIDPRPSLGAVLVVGRMRAKVVRRHEQGVGVVFVGSANRMDEVIKETTATTVKGVDGAEIAPSFGKKTASA